MRNFDTGRIFFVPAGFFPWTAYRMRVGDNRTAIRRRDDAQAEFQGSVTQP
jgi:hypothetical protein